jgi:hypothetical protein
MSVMSLRARRAKEWLDQLDMMYRVFSALAECRPHSEVLYRLRFIYGCGVLG